MNPPSHIVDEREKGDTSTHNASPTVMLQRKTMEKNAWGKRRERARTTFSSGANIRTDSLKVKSTGRIPAISMSAQFKMVGRLGPCISCGGDVRRASDLSHSSRMKRGTNPSLCSPSHSAYGAKSACYEGADTERGMQKESSPSKADPLRGSVQITSIRESEPSTLPPR